MDDASFCESNKTRFERPDRSSVIGEEYTKIPDSPIESSTSCTFYHEVIPHFLRSSPFPWETNTKPPKAIEKRVSNVISNTYRMPYRLCGPYYPACFRVPPPLGYLGFRQKLRWLFNI